MLRAAIAAGGLGALAADRSAWGEETAAAAPVAPKDRLKITKLETLSGQAALAVSEDPHQRRHRRAWASRSWKAAR